MFWKYAVNLQENIHAKVNTLRHGCSPVNLLHIFRTPFTNNTSGWLLLSHSFAVESTVVIRISWSHCKAQNPRGKMILGQFSSYVIVKDIFILLQKINSYWSFTISSIQIREFSIFKEMLFTETNETNIGYLHSLFFVFEVDKAFFNEFLWLCNEIENVNSSFWCIVKITNLKIRLWNHHPVKGQSSQLLM